MFQRVLNGILRIKYLVILSILILSIISLYLIRGLVIEGDILEYMPSEDEDVRFFKEIGNKYLANYFIMVGIEAERDYGVFDKAYLKKIEELTEAYKGIEGVYSVFSLTNIMDIKKIEDGIEVSDLIKRDEIESLSQKDLQRLQEYVLTNERYVNKIVSVNGRFSQIIIRPSAEVERERIVNRVEEVSRSILRDSGYKFYAGGWPVAIRDTNEATLKDLKKLTPIVIVISMFVLFMGFRTLRGVLIPIIVVIVANLFIFALMALMKKPVTLGTSAIPVILISTGTAYAIHIINQYYFHSSKSYSKAEIILHALSDKWKAVLLSALTTIAGFATLTTATLTTVVDLGIFMTLGILFSFLMAVIAVPAILDILPIRKAKKVLSEEEALTQTRGIFLPFVEKIVLNSYQKVIILFAVLSLMLLPTLVKLTADVNPINYFKEDAPIRKSEQLLVDHFGGAVPVFVLIKGEVKDPRVMYVTEMLEREIEAIDVVGNAQSVASIVADLNYNLVNFYNIPESSGKIGNLWFFVEGNEYLNQFVTKEMDESVILARIESLQKSQVQYANRQIRGLIKRIPDKYKMVRKSEYTGEEYKGLLEYQKSHIMQRIKTEFKIAKLEIEDSALKNLVDIIADKKFGDLILNEEECLFLYKEIKQRSAKIKDEFGIDINLDRIEASKRCRYNGWEGFDVISGKVIPDESELEGSIREEIEDLRESIRTYQDQLIIRHLVRSYLGSRIAQSMSLKHIEGLLGLLLNDVIVVGCDYSGFNNLKDDPVKIDMKYGGLGPVISMLDDNLMKNQITSIIMALILVFALMYYLTRSLKVSLISMIPILFTLLVDFSIMAIAGIAIDDVTIVIASILIGVGIDYTIHTITGIKLGYEKFMDDDKAISFAIRVIGRAVFLNTTAVALGFLALIFGDFIPLRNMGLLTAVTMFIAAGSAVILIPAFVKLLKSFNIKEVKL